MSSAQQDLWLADRGLPGSTQYLLGRVVHLDGRLDVSALKSALGGLVARHEVLRTRVDGLSLVIDPPGGFELPVIDLPAQKSDRRAEVLGTMPFRPAERLWRAELHRLAPERHRLVLVWHHVIADYSTIALLLREIGAGYRSLLGDSAELPAARPFSEYVAWEKTFLASHGSATQVAYWIEQVSDVPTLALPADRPRRAESRHPGVNLRFGLETPVADALRGVARGRGATLAQVMLACYATMLQRYAGQDELLVGVPLSIRHGKRWATSAGLFVNTLPIRVSARDNPPFTDLLAQVRGTLFAALGMADAPLAAVAADPRVHRSAGTGRLFDVTFGLTTRRLDMNLPGISSRITSVYCGQVKFDLHLEVVDDGPGLPIPGLMEYDADLFDDGTAQRFADGFAAVAAAVAAKPDQPVGNIGLYSYLPGGRPPDPRFSDSAGAGKPARSGTARVDRLFTSCAAARPGSIAIIDAADGVEYSYADVVGRARDVAAVLASRGIGRGDFVGITLPRSFELVVALLGVLLTGAAYVPLDASYPMRRLSDMIENAGVGLIIGPAPGELGVPAIALPAPGSGGREAAARRPAPPGGAPESGVRGSPPGEYGEDPAYVMFTSGSTGAPKAVLIPHRAIVRLVRGADFAAMTTAERWLHCASPSFDASTLEVWAPLLNGGSVVVLPGTPTVADLGATIKRHNVTSAFLTTGLFNLVVDTDIGALQPLRELIIGGEAASVTHVTRALGVVPSVTNGYGPTENTTFTTCHAVGDPTRLTGAVPIGTAIPGTLVHIVDAYLNPMPPGAVGEIVTGGLGVAIGYANAPALTAERFVPDPFGPPGSRLYRTGDYGKLDEEGTLHFAGRIDGQVKMRGFRIELGAIEHAVATHPGVSQAAVIVHADPSGDRRLVGYTVGTAAPSELTAHLRTLLPGYMIPGQWINLDALPLGPTGKVDRGALPPPVGGQASGPHGTGVVADLIVSWYTELLGHSDIDQDTDFYAVGGHSLFAARLVSRIKVAFGVELSLSVVFDNPRIASLAAVVAQSAAGYQETFKTEGPGGHQ